MIKYYIVIGIIYMIPYMVMIGISCLKDKLETDRNFYGKDIDPKEIKLINVSYKKLKIERKNLKNVQKWVKSNIFIHKILEMNN